MNGLTQSNSHHVGCGLRLPRDFQSGLAAGSPVFTHPDQVVRDQVLTLTEKREILASWASDTRAVENEPALRQLDSGAVLRVEEILQALKSLDRADLLDDSGVENLLALRPPFGRRNRRGLRVWRNERLRWDSPDDDDPPPLPARAPFPDRGPPPCPAVAGVSVHQSSAPETPEQLLLRSLQAAA
jgi:hypothetical protein